MWSRKEQKRQKQLSPDRFKYPRTDSLVPGTLKAVRGMLVFGLWVSSLFDLKPKLLLKGAASDVFIIGRERYGLGMSRSVRNNYPRTDFNIPAPIP
mgnify:CR=1 FL=1